MFSDSSCRPSWWRRSSTIRLPRASTSSGSEFQHSGATSAYEVMSGWKTAPTGRNETLQLPWASGTLPAKDAVGTAGSAVRNRPSAISTG